jgi:cyclic pyranopterin phosphate synthase
MDISYIEEMPVGVIGGRDRANDYYSSQRVLADLSARYRLTPSRSSTGGPSRYYDVAGHAGRVGFISPHSHDFCDTCNRVRVTAQGRLLLCLGQEHSVDLRRVLRAHPADDTAVRRAILDAMGTKPRGHEFDLAAPPVIVRHMNTTGG